MILNMDKIEKDVKKNQKINLSNDDNIADISPKEIILRIQHELVNFIVDMASFRQQNTKQTLIIGYILFNDHLTQEEIHKLTKNSRGTISSQLNSMIENKRLIKRFNKVTRKFEYQIDPNSAPSSFAITQGKEILSKEIRYFKETISLLQTDQYLGMKGSLYLVNRLNQLIKSFYFMISVSDLMSNQMQNPSQPLPVLTIDDFEPKDMKFFDPVELSNDLSTIEREILEYLVSNQVLRHHSEITAEILGYFYLRGDLTQEILQNITTFSAGAISNSIKELEKFQYVEKATPRKRPYHYLMPSIIHSIIKLFCLSLKNILKWMDKIEEIRYTLSKIHNEAENLPNYTKMLRFVNGIFIISPMYQLLLDNLNNILEKK
jgi:DNA-binding transcriptional regulator GbsR (MarR family)